MRPWRWSDSMRASSARILSMWRSSRRRSSGGSFGSGPTSRPAGSSTWSSGSLIAPSTARLAGRGLRSGRGRRYAELPEQELHLVGAVLDLLRDRLAAGMPGLGVVVEQDGPLAAGRGLHERRHLAGVERIHAGVRIAAP